ncbi:hypothetical protein LC040_01175 [Bacillus tianshenii]|nr:hypothetical protein LC040_01175 [Bacillus tianshenii]
MMRRRTVAMLAGVGAATAVTAVMNKDKLQTATSKVTDKIKKQNSDREDSLPIEKAGKSSPEDLENNKMVSEGSQFGPNYYHNYKYAEQHEQETY